MLAIKSLLIFSEFSQDSLRPLDRAEVESAGKDTREEQRINQREMDHG